MTKPKTLAIGTIALAMVVAMGTADAHHSRANFNLDKSETFQGTVVRFAWTNPHTAIYLKTVEPDGSSVVRTLEGNSIPTMVRRGWAQDSVKPGDVLTIKANPDKNPNRHFYYLLSANRDGKQIGGGFGDNVIRTAFVPPPPASSSPFVGVWRPVFSFGGGGGGGANGKGGNGGGRSILLASP